LNLHQTPKNADIVGDIVW